MFDPVEVDVWETVRELQFELDITNERLERAFEQIADLAQLVEESIEYQQETVEHLYQLHLPLD